MAYLSALDLILMSVDSDFLSALGAGLVLDPEIPMGSYTPIDLSVHNAELVGVELGNPDACQAYVDYVRGRAGARVAYGGYLERRNLYKGNDHFSERQEIREVHLGVDFWAPAGTVVVAPLSGTVHSFKNNAAKGDYGPTILLEHRAGGITLFTLYGHLSVESLSGLYPGKRIKQGDVLATLGTPMENVNYAPHLHFQLILDLQGYKGDYPGVCSASEVDFYRENCPNPGMLFPMLPD